MVVTAVVTAEEESVTAPDLSRGVFKRDTDFAETETPFSGSAVIDAAVAAVVVTDGLVVAVTVIKDGLD